MCGKRGGTDRTGNRPYPRPGLRTWFTSDDPTHPTCSVGHTHFEFVSTVVEISKGQPLRCEIPRTLGERELLDFKGRGTLIFIFLCRVIEIKTVQYLHFNPVPPYENIRIIVKPSDSGVQVPTSRLINTRGFTILMTTIGNLYNH